MEFYWEYFDSTHGSRPSSLVITHDQVSRLLCSCVTATRMGWGNVVFNTRPASCSRPSSNSLLSLLQQPLPSIYLGLLEPRGCLSSAAHSSHDDSPKNSLTDGSTSQWLAQALGNATRQPITGPSGQRLGGLSTLQPAGSLNSIPPPQRALSTSSSTGAALVLDSDDPGLYDSIHLHNTEGGGAGGDTDSVCSQTSQGVAMPPEPPLAYQHDTHRPALHPMSGAWPSVLGASGGVKGGGIGFSGLQSGFLTQQQPMLPGPGMRHSSHRQQHWPNTHNVSGDADGSGDGEGGSDYLWDAGVDDTTSMQHSEAAREHEEDLMGFSDTVEQHLYAPEFGAGRLAGVCDITPAVTPSFQQGRGAAAARSAAALKPSSHQGQELRTVV